MIGFSKWLKLSETVILNEADKLVKSNLINILDSEKSPELISPCFFNSKIESRPVFLYGSFSYIVVSCNAGTDQIIVYKF